MTTWDDHWPSLEVALQSVAEEVKPRLPEPWRVWPTRRDRWPNSPLGGHFGIHRHRGSYEHWWFELKIWVQGEPTDARIDLRSQLERGDGAEFWNLRYVACGGIEVGEAFAEFLNLVSAGWTDWIDVIDDLPPIP